MPLFLKSASKIGASIAVAAMSFASFFPAAAAIELSDVIKVSSSSSELDARATPKS